MEKFIDCDDICNMFNLSVSQDFIKDFYDIEPDSESEGKYLWSNKRVHAIGEVICADIMETAISYSMSVFN